MAIAGQARGHKMQFHSWKSGAAVSPEMLSPSWLAWDPAVTACALAYPDSIVLCRAQPNFSAFLTIPLQVSTSTQSCAAEMSEASMRSRLCK